MQRIVNSGNDMLDAAPGTVVPREGNGDKERVVIVPTYNEAQNLKVLVSRILRAGPFHILIVDDNSPDGTGELAEDLARRSNGRLAVLHRPAKQGLGPAYLAGLGQALTMGYRRIFTMDADLSHDPGSLPVLNNALEESDVVLGSRFVAGGSSQNWPWWRRLLSRGGSAYARVILGLPIYDVTTGFKGFRRPVLERLLPELDTLHVHGYAFQIETTYLCAQEGFHVTEVPINFANRRAGQSKMHLGIVLEALWWVWALRLGAGTASPAQGVPGKGERQPRRRLALLLPLALLLFTLVAMLLVPRLATLGATQASALHPATPTAPVPTVSVHGPNASIQIQDANLTPNAPLAFIGTKFQSGEPLTATIQDAQGKRERQLEPMKADGDGHVSVVVAPIYLTLPPGSHTLVVQGMHSQRTGEAHFQVHWMQPTLQLTSYYAKAREQVSFSGSGFVGNESVAVRLDPADAAANGPPSAPLATVQANAGGNVTGALTIPPTLPAGNYTLTALGDQSQAPITVKFDVQDFHPWVVLDNYAPTPQTKLGFNGQDFAPGEAIQVYLNQRQSDPLLEVHADPRGNFAAPAGWSVTDLSGPQTLIFVGQQSGAVAEVQFTVEPPVGK